MSEKLVTVKNVSGGDRVSPYVGSLANDASGVIPASILLIHRDWQRVLAADVLAADSEVVFDGGAPLTNLELERFAEVWSARAAMDAPPLLDAVDGAVAAAGGDVVVLGSDLLQGQLPDGITIGSGADQVDFELLTPGDSGQTLELVNTGSLSVAFDGTKWTIGFNAGVDTANAIATFVNSDATAKGRLMCTGGGVGTATPATPETALAGGVGNFAANSLSVAGVAALPKSNTGPTPAATWTDASIELTHAALTGLVASDIARIRVRSNGLSDAIDAVLS